MSLGPDGFVILFLSTLLSLVLSGQLPPANPRALSTSIETHSQGFTPVDHLRILRA